LRNAFAHNFSVDGKRDRSTISSDFGRNACVRKNDECAKRRFWKRPSMCCGNVRTGILRGIGI
jgi:hypothetical protein